MNPNMAASVHQRLLNLARSRQRPFNELLHFYALERFLYRLGRSRYRDQFVLKGALMFSVWEAPFLRTTRDIDLLGHLDNSLEYITHVIGEICRQPVPEDGLQFDEKTIAGESIIEGVDYEGVRVQFNGYLEKSRIPMQIDIGFGDRIIPHSTPIVLPTLLDFPPPALHGYSRESTIAEKLQSMVRLGAINSRMKDFFDIWWLAENQHFSGPVLNSAIEATFSQRTTPVTDKPTAFTPSFTESPEKQGLWEAFVRRYHLGKDTQVPSTLSTVITDIAAFLQPVLAAAVKGESFAKNWLPGGPWVNEGQGDAHFVR